MSNSNANSNAGHDSVSTTRRNTNEPFDVDREWGRPLSLPSPQPPSMAVNNNSAKLPPLPPQSHARNQSQERTSTRKPPMVPTENGDSSGSKSRIHPVYVELAYVPGHGKRGYCDEAFFRKIRARYYVFSGVTPCRAVFDALLRAKASWEQNLYVTIIPTYESEALCGWIADNQARLTELRIDVTPAANRCSINLAESGNTSDDSVQQNAAQQAAHPQESCAAYKVEL